MDNPLQLESCTTTPITSTLITTIPIITPTTTIHSTITTTSITTTTTIPTQIQTQITQIHSTTTIISTVNKLYSPRYKFKKKGHMCVDDRIRVLKEDPSLIPESVKPRSVRCRGCSKVVKIDKRSLPLKELFKIKHLKMNN